MTLRPQLAYLDEYGNTDLETSKEGASTYFIITAVIINKDDEKAIEGEAVDIQKQYFPNGEIKSNRVGRNDNRRIEVLNALKRLKFRFYALAIDKREINKNSGLIYKKSFLKFLNGQLYRKLYRTFPQIKVFADEVGSSEFMAGFCSYVEKKYIYDLFLRAEFQFSKSEEKPLIQVADFISGSLARVFDPQKISENAEEILSILNDKTISIDEWPPQIYLYHDAQKGISENVFDSTVREQSVYQAKLFLRRFMESEEEKVILQIETLKYLLYNLQFVNSKEYVTTAKIISMLDSDSSLDISEYYFRANIIARLRDEGVIIAASSKGYKIPSSVADIDDFLDHQNTIIQPMLERIQKVRESIRLASRGDLDIVDNEEFAYLKKVLDA